MNAVVTEAHGRVNLIGEHTDYNGGWVLPTLIPQKTTIHLKKRPDPKVHAASRSMVNGKTDCLEFDLGREERTGTWIDYLQGATRILRDKGYQFSGFDVHVESDVPIGSGLSSSAALEISFLKALRQAYHLKLNDIEVAQMGQKIENDFVGARVGIMDQMACSLAKAGEALFLDTQTLSFEQVPLDYQQMDLVVINSGLAHQNSGGDYNQRRSECEKACELLGIHQLRDLSMADIHKIDSLPELLKRRARHVITENQRVHDAVHAIREGDMRKLGDLFKASHISMRDDYQVSIPEIDLLVEICNGMPEVFGARLTGGGFGGSIVAITRPNSSVEVAEKAVRSYNVKTGQVATILVPSVSF